MTSPDMAQRCGNCAYWKRGDEMIPHTLERLADVYGRCRRYPPQPLNDKFGIHTVTMETDYCGEYKQHPQPRGEE